MHSAPLQFNKATAGIFLAVAFGLFALGMGEGCSSKVVQKKAHYEVVKVDTIHGISYPYDFSRARDLLDNGLYEAAAYSYVMLYPTSPDSTVHECLKMAAVLEADHALHSLVWYLKQSLGTEAIQDPEYFKNGTVNDAAVKKRYESVNELVYALQQYGVK